MTPESAARAEGARAEALRDRLPVATICLLAGVSYYVLIWKQTTSTIVRSGVGLVALIGLTLVAMLLLRDARGRDTWEAFLVRSRLLVVLVLAIFGAAFMGVVLSESDRALGVKLFAVAFFSALPAWFYWLFITRKGPALWDEYTMNLHRLGIDRPGSLPEPPLHSPFHLEWARDRATIATEQPAEDNYYRKKFDGAFGSMLSDPSKAVFGTENALPVVASTVLISVGWAVVLQPETVFAYGVLPPFKASGLPNVPIEALRFAFLGAYFYVLQMLVRRFYSNDLKAGAYVNATVRIVVVLLLTWILGTIWNDEATRGWQLGAAFTIGVLPDVGWQLLQRAVKVPLARATNAFKQRYPLSELDGFNLWYESRLVEEGVEDMQTLVTANLVDLMLHTRVPVERLVDWLDQAILALHLPPGIDDHSPRSRLRQYGIRTATDLLDAHDRRGRVWRVPGIERVLNAANDPPEAPVVLDAVRTSLRREPVLVHVRHWRSFVNEHLLHAVEERAVVAVETVYADRASPAEAGRGSALSTVPTSFRA